MIKRPSPARLPGGEAASPANVILVSMPFASPSGPSPALSQLKPLLARAGIPCDVFYGDLAFRAFCGGDEACSRIASQWLAGEWVFGPAFFDDEFLCSKRRDVDALCRVLPVEERDAALRDVKRLAGNSKPFIEHLIEIVNWGNYAVVGFSSVFAQNISSLALASAIKQRWPQTLIAFGGANVAGKLGRSFMRCFPFVDWIVNGEGDIAFPEAVGRLSVGESPHGVEGVTYRRLDGEIVQQGLAPSADLDDLPYPDFDDYLRDMRTRAPELESEIELPIEMSRGCWWADRSKCIFCALNASLGRYRQKSPRRVIEEVETLVGRYGIRRLRCVDNNIPRHAFRDVFPTLAKNVKLDGLFVETMASLNKENLSVLAAAGTKVLQPGIESLDTAHLRLMKKGTTMLHNVQLLKWSRELNLRVTWNFLYGFPGEDPASYERMPELIKSLMHLEPPRYVMKVVLQPFSPLWEDASHYGVENVRPSSAYTAIYPFHESELFELAYAYDFDRVEDDRLAASSAGALAALEEWKKSWSEGRPPLLGFLACDDGRIKIYDTRPIRAAAVDELEGPAAAAYVACDQRQSARTVARVLRQSPGGPDLTLEDTIAVLDDLVDRRLMVKEGTNYVSLAYDLRRRQAASPMAAMLVGLETLAARAAR